MIPHRTSQLVLLTALALLSRTARPQAPGNCEHLPHPGHPTARIADGALSAVLFLPDPQTGFYRGSRFDWSGLVACAALNGHTFWGEWFSQYDPLANDAVTGPAEEFRHPTSELGYDDAPPGGLFLKIGVGTLRRLSPAPYRFGDPYPIVDHGRWTIQSTPRSVTFRQELHSSIGFAYLYEKTLTLNGNDEHATVLTLQHSLRNLGTKPLDTAVYNHDFFMLDQQPTGPAMELRLPFAPIPDKPLPDTTRIDGHTIRFLAPLQPRRGVGAYLTGFSSALSDFDFLFEDQTSGLGIEQTSDSPLVRMYLWATPTTVCPEGYLAIHVPPGQAQTWSLRYRLFTR